MNQCAICVLNIMQLITVLIEMSAHRFYKFPVSKSKNCLKFLPFITILTLKVRLQLEELLNYDSRLNWKATSEWIKY